MKKTHSFTLIAFFFSTLALAQTTQLDMKEGLWEITVSHSMTGGPQMPTISQEDLAQMPAAQRAQIEGMMKRVSGSTTTHKECVTKESIAKNRAFNSRHKDCEHVALKSSSKHFEAQFNCDAKHGKSKGKLTVKVVDANTVTGTMHTTSKAEGSDLAVDVTFTSKYLGADCGDVKP